jgi:hypothetical protein
MIALASQENPIVAESSSRIEMWNNANPSRCQAQALFQLIQSSCVCVEGWEISSVWNSITHDSSPSFSELEVVFGSQQV